MQAVLLTGHGGFERLEYRTDVPVPVPHEHEVLIRIGAAGVNNTDINTRTGWYAHSVTDGTTAAGAAAGYGGTDVGWSGAPSRFPRIQGADACGRIVAVGAGVDPARIGERVLVEPVFRTADGVAYFGSECDGGFADFARVPAAQAHPIASGLSDAELASFPCSYAAAEHMLARAAVTTGETVLVTGASGGVGSAAVQPARRRGAAGVAIAGEAKAGCVAALGAARAITREADPVAALGAGSIDVVIDVVGGAQFAALLAVLRCGGRYATAGAIAGPTVALDLRTLYLKDLTPFGCTVFPPEVFANLIGYIERNEIAPLVAGTYPLREIVAAQTAFLSKAHTGKIVLIPDG